MQTWLRSCIAVVWRRPAAVALIQPLAWEPPNAMGTALKRKGKKKKKKGKKRSTTISTDPKNKTPIQKGKILANPS